MRAARGEQLEVPPVWLMRQAGRYLPEYRKVREAHDFLEVCYTPELACEVTLQPIRRFKFDASILFSDILVPLVPMGMDLSFGKGHGPQISNPCRTVDDISKLRKFDPRSEMSMVLDAVRMIRGELPSDVALIGFAGAPFTLAAYMIEGGKPQPFANLKGLMYTEPAVFSKLLERLADMVAEYLRAMVEAGANALQLFDTWAGILSANDFNRINLPVLKMIFKRLSDLNVPLTYFVHGGMHLLPSMQRTGATVLSLDWRTPLSEARAIVGPGPVLQGNLDATILLGKEAMIRTEVARIVEEGRAVGPHIFNLGHGILPNTSIASVEVMLDTIRGAK
jgi:uroporphyrinogen decarboxylase